MTSPTPASLARRAMPAVVLAGTSVILLTQLDAPAPSAPAALDAPLGATGTSRGVAPATSTPGTLPAPAADSTVPATPLACSGDPVTGPTVETRWGPVQVAAVLDTSGAVCEVQALQAPSDDRRSLMINQRALPILHDRAVAAKGTGFQAVSGATITSQGYRASLQAILDGA